MTNEPLRRVEIDARGPADASVIWLHGLGADGHDFEPVVPHLGAPPGTRFVFPHAPAIPVTVNGGMVMPAWYDILALDLERRVDEDGVRRSADAVAALIGEERERGIPSERIVLAGFSQGGAIALHLGLRHPERLAGILALSTYLAVETGLEEERSAANAETPILQAHGTHDPMVRLERGEAARDRLTALGYSVTWKQYPIEHAVSMDEIQDVGAWLREVLG